MASGNARSFLSKLPFEAKDIPKFNVHDDQVKNYLKKGQPIVITDSGLCKTALRWDLEFLEEHMGGKHYVHFSDTPSFMYFDEKKMVHYPDFKPPTQRRDMSFSSFCKTFRELKDSTSQYIYYQQQLTDTVDSEIKQDFIKFNWQWLNEQKRTYNFGDLTSNLLLISHPGNYTPCHYDEQQNFFTMVYCGMGTHIQQSPSITDTSGTTKQFVIQNFPLFRAYFIFIAICLNPQKQTVTERFLL
jgi:hypoxia-inducible factor 1-alpha inhibitor (HIF hydroxylase)